MTVSKYLKVLISASPEINNEITSFKLLDEETIALILDILYHDVIVDTMNIEELFRFAEYMRSVVGCFGFDPID